MPPATMTSGTPKRQTASHSDTCGSWQLVGW
jgi:hypothetical protein